MNTIYQAIETKYLGPTNYRGSRITAKAPAGKVTLEWNYELSTEENHVEAAKALANKFEWNYDEMVTGALGNSYVHALKR